MNFVAGYVMVCKIYFKTICFRNFSGSRWNVSLWNLSNVNFVAGYVMNFILFGVYVVNFVVGYIMNFVLFQYYLF